MFAMPEKVEHSQLINALRDDYKIVCRNLATQGLRRVLAKHMVGDETLAQRNFDTAYFWLQPERVNVRNSRIIAGYVREALLAKKENEVITFPVGTKMISFTPSKFPVNDFMVFDENEQVCTRGYSPATPFYYYDTASEVDKSFVTLAITIIRDTEKFLDVKLDYPSDYSLDAVF